MWFCAAALVPTGTLLERSTLALGEGDPGLVTQHRRAMFTNHLGTDGRFLRDAVKTCGFESFIGMPLPQGRGPVGYLGVGWKRATVPADWAFRLLETLTPVVARVASTRRPARLPARPGWFADSGRSICVMVRTA